MGIVDFVHGPTKVTAKEFKEPFLNKDIQVKEGEALTSTIQILLTEHLRENFNLQGPGGQPSA